MTSGSPSIPIVRAVLLSHASEPATSIVVVASQTAFWQWATLTWQPVAR